MADYRKIARAKARKYGLDPSVFARQINAESGFNPRARSRVGAQGIAQIMPGTAKAWGVNPMDPVAALDAAAKNMAAYVRKYGGYENALRAYNAGPGAIEKSKSYAETNNYVKKILGGKGEPKTKPKAKRSGTRTIPGRAGTPGKYTPIKRETDYVGAITDALLMGKKGRRGQPLLQAALGLVDTGEYTTVSGGTYERGEPGTPSRVVKRKPKSRSTAGRNAAQTAIQLSRLLDGHGLRTTSGKRDTVYTASGNISDHAKVKKNASARDKAGTVEQMDAGAVALARELGIKGYKKGQPLVATVRRNGQRIQVLYRTNVGGDHFDHIHVGVEDED